MANFAHVQTRVEHGSTVAKAADEAHDEKDRDGRCVVHNDPGEDPGDTWQQ